jgi:CheY-like chemotaxis protein
MKGTYRVSSALGVGSTFYCTLPLKVDRTQYTSLDASRVNIDVNNYGDTLEALSPILIVDDNQLICSLTKNILSSWGIESEVAHNGKDALDMIRQAPFTGHGYKAILIDNMMPVMNGREAVMIMREEGYTFPVVGISGDSESIDRAIRDGYDYVLSKPISKDKLLGIMKEIALKI